MEGTLGMEREARLELTESLRDLNDSASFKWSISHDQCVTGLNLQVTGPFTSLRRLASSCFWYVAMTSVNSPRCSSLKQRGRQALAVLNFSFADAPLTFKASP